MKTTFTMEISTDVPARDEARRKAFLELMMQSARKLYAQCAMLSDQIPPDINIVTNDTRDGTIEHPLFPDREPV